MYSPVSLSDPIGGFGMGGIMLPTVPVGITQPLYVHSLGGKGEQGQEEDDEGGVEEGEGEGGELTVTTAKATTSRQMFLAGCSCPLCKDKDKGQGQGRGNHPLPPLYTAKESQPSMSYVQTSTLTSTQTTSRAATPCTQSKQPKQTKMQGTANTSKSPVHSIDMNRPFLIRQGTSSQIYAFNNSSTDRPQIPLSHFLHLHLTRPTQPRSTVQQHPR